MRIIFRKGKLGGWRWFVQADGKIRAQSTKFWGWPTKSHAMRDAIEVMGAALHIADGETLLYAGPRDFSD